MKFETIIEIIENTVFTFTSYHCLTHDKLVHKPYGCSDCKFEKGDTHMNLKEILNYLEDDCLPF